MPIQFVHQFPWKYSSLYKKHVDTTLLTNNQLFNFTQKYKITLSIPLVPYSTKFWISLLYHKFWSIVYSKLYTRFPKYRNPLTIFILPSFEPILFLITQLNNFAIIKHHLYNHLPSTTIYHSMIIFTDFFWILTLPG